MARGYWIGHISITDPEKYEEYKSAEDRERMLDVEQCALHRDPITYSPRTAMHPS
jgi:hypothetical protein